MVCHRRNAFQNLNYFAFSKEKQAYCRTHPPNRLISLILDVRCEGRSFSEKWQLILWIFGHLSIQEASIDAMVKCWGVNDTTAKGQIFVGKSYPKHILASYPAWFRGKLSYPEKKDTGILRSVSIKDACHGQLQSIIIVIPRVNKVICCFQLNRAFSVYVQDKLLTV